MDSSLDRHVEQLTWKMARHDIQAVNPILAEIIDNWSPPDDFGLVRIRYRYGDRILKDGVL